MKTQSNRIRMWSMALMVLVALGLFSLSDMVAPMDAGASAILVGTATTAGSTLTFNIDCYLGNGGCTPTNLAPFGTVTATLLAGDPGGFSQAVSTYLSVTVSMVGSTKVGEVDFNYNFLEAISTFDQHFLYQSVGGATTTFSDPVGEDNVSADGCIGCFDLEVLRSVSGPPPNEPFTFLLALDNKNINLNTLFWTQQGNGFGGPVPPVNDAWVGLHWMAIDCSLVLDACQNQGITNGQSFWAGALPNAVPEPSSLLLLGSGLAGLGFWARRRKQG